MTYCPEAARLGRPIARKPPKGKSHFPLGGFARRTGCRPLTCAFAERGENPSGGKWDFHPRALHVRERGTCFLFTPSRQGAAGPPCGRRWLPSRQPVHDPESRRGSHSELSLVPASAASREALPSTNPETIQGGARDRSGHSGPGLRAANIVHNRRCRALTRAESRARRHRSVVGPEGGGKVVHRRIVMKEEKMQLWTPLRLLMPRVASASPRHD